VSKPSVSEETSSADETVQYWLPRMGPQDSCRYRTGLFNCDRDETVAETLLRVPQHDSAEIFDRAHLFPKYLELGDPLRVSTLAGASGQ